MPSAMLPSVEKMLCSHRWIQWVCLHTYDIREQVSLADCHAHSNVTSDVHKVHMQMVVAWLVVAKDSQVLSQYAILHG